MSRFDVEQFNDYNIDIEEPAVKDIHIDIADLLFWKHNMEIPETSGIYFITFQDEIIYIGQSNDIKRRIEEHVDIKTLEKAKEELNNQDSKETYASRALAYSRYSFFQENLKDLFIEYRETPIELLNVEEEYYIGKYKPIFNYAGVHSAYKPYERK